jgi:predicted Fe-Mo cluster-binding NifX family protein
MLACIPTRGNAGLEDAVSDHFGSTPFFTLYDTETDELTVIPNRNAHHDHGTCHPMNQLAKYHINCVVCSGMGRRAIEALNTEGITVYQSEPTIVGEVVKKIKAGSLTEIDPAKACRGHGQRFGSIEEVHGVTQGRGAGYGGCRRQGQDSGGRHGRGRN